MAKNGNDQHVRAGFFDPNRDGTTSGMERAMQTAVLLSLLEEDELDDTLDDELDDDWYDDSELNDYDDIDGHYDAPIIPSKEYSTYSSAPGSSSDDSDKELEGKVLALYIAFLAIGVIGFFCILFSG